MSSLIPGDAEPSGERTEPRCSAPSLRAPLEEPRPRRGFQTPPLLGAVPRNFGVGGSKKKGRESVLGMLAEHPSWLGRGGGNIGGSIRKIWEEGEDPQLLGGCTEPSSLLFLLPHPCLILPHLHGATRCRDLRSTSAGTQGPGKGERILGVRSWRQPRALSVRPGNFPKVPPCRGRASILPVRRGGAGSWPSALREQPCSFSRSVPTSAPALGEQEQPRCCPPVSPISLCLGFAARWKATEGKGGVLQHRAAFASAKLSFLQPF